MTITANLFNNNKKKIIKIIVNYQYKRINYTHTHTHIIIFKLY